MASRSRLWTLTLLFLSACTCSRCSGPPVPDAGPPQVQAPVAPAVAPVRLKAIVLEISGDAQVLRAGEDEWVRLTLGEPVRPGDSVRTGEDGALSLGFGEARLRVEEGSQLELQLFEAQRVRASLAGRAEASAPGADLTFQISSPGGGVATLASGRAALRNGLAQAAAAALEGKLSLSAPGGQVELSPGQYSLLADGQRWGQASPLPARPALRVRWPSRTLTNKAELTLEGRGDGLSRVWVQGRPVATAADGSFEAKVRLRRGRQRVRVVAADVLGHKVTRSRWITLDPDAPTIRAKVQFR